MAIVIKSQPIAALGIVRAYEPMLYAVGITTLGTAPPALLAYVEIDGVAFGSPSVITPTEQLLPSGEYLFYYDPKLIIQSYFDNEQSWGAINAQTNKVEPLPNKSNTGFSKECVFEVYFIAYEQIPPSTSLEATDAAIGNPLQAFNGRATSYSTQNTNPYFSYPAQWLHNYSRISLNTQRADAFVRNGGNNFFLSYYCQGNKDEALRIRLYDFNSTLISTYFLDLNQTDDSINRIRQLGVGVANINNAAPADWKGGAPTQPLITNAVYYYEVDVVWTDAMLSILQIITRPFRFFVTDTCDQIQLFYCNEFGAMDVVLFKYNDCTFSYKNENQNYRNPILSFPTPALRGLTTTNSTGQTLFNLKGLFAQNRMNQLRELWHSPNIAILLPNSSSFIMVVKADDTEMVIKPARNGRVEFEINLIQSTVDNSQRG